MLILKKGAFVLGKLESFPVINFSKIILCKTERGRPLAYDYVGAIWKIPLS